ncbi:MULTISPECIES: hydrogenase maturation nickel metallochaperone HypA [unclassified Nitratiruptor]|uniref:hydrogenase maturation nickel metallochaperone HypA n=1 Tax=unclassified Nitratiruptor TaxID=2624044 RepID=UPI001914F400|nr:MULTISPECIES: hydrogenase maturation nickel metallochaperone HypA [unclassified Nitratiruptor]BCD60306.1 hydrogenase nickel incorporation protein HypA/HybF [Nitratiruptor sp. YY08-10]BCD64204.1 hydrogenase nickel incorporation protein HypA/HybF [Nitratiruptor sp. YY08-14]
MHEYSIVQSMLDLIEENAKKHNATKVERVVMKIGVMSGVEAHLLKIAFDTFKEGTLCSDAELEMIIQPIIAKCRTCKKESRFEKNEIFYECKQCGDVDLEIIDGEDMILMQLDMS